MKLKKIVAHNMKLIRSARNLNQATLAVRTKTNRSTILRLERAEKSPTLDMLEKISDGLRCLYSELFAVPEGHTPDCRKRRPGGACNCFYDEYRNPVIKEGSQRS